jgi:dTDP-4-dehydrorhamnose reductase
MRILVTGAAGMLGQDVCRTAAAAGVDVSGLSRGELDIADAVAVSAAMTDARPDVVINCAAWNNVDGAEADEEGATAVNGIGAGNVAAAASAAGAWTIHISSDYVFDGSKRTPYLESDATGPVSAYGRSKLAGELAVAAAAPERHTIIRTSWLFGAGGPCFPKTIMRLASERDEVSVVNDQVGCPTFTDHLAPAIVELADDPVPGVVHVAAASDCSWFAFATEIVAAAGIDCDVRPCTTVEMPRPAARPAYSVLRSERGERVPALPDWRDGLSAFITTVVRAA